jgi:hypothetical protein
MSAFPRLPFFRRPLQGCLSVAGLGLAVPLLAQIVVPEWALPAEYGADHPDVVVFTVGGVRVRGDEARFAQRTGLHGDFIVGIDRLSIFRELGEDFDRVLKVDFRGLLGEDEGELAISYEKLESWRFEIFADFHRRYFDPDPATATLFIPDFAAATDPLQLDFGRIRFEAEKSFENFPTLRVRYSHFWRDGTRDSTVWGQLGARRVNPATRVLDETRHTLEVEAEKRGESTHWRVTGHASRGEHSTTLRVVNDSLVNPPEPIEQVEKTETESKGLRGFVSGQPIEGLTVSLGALVHQVDANVSGYRMVSNGSAFVNLRGDSKLHQYVANGNLAYRWNARLDSVLAVGVRGETIEAETSKNRGAAADLVNSRDERDHVDVAFETRLRGSRLAGLYLLVKSSRGDGVLSEEGNRISRLTDSREDSRRYALGVRLYPHPKASLSGELYHQARTTDFVHERLDAFPALYPGLIDSLEEEIEAADLRFTVRPLERLHLVSRVDYQHRTLRPGFTTGDAAGETDVDHLTLSQNIAFTPTPRWHAQAGISWTENLRRTPLSGASAELARILPESTNDHWSLHAGLYGTLGEKTDLQLSYTYFRTSNHVANEDVAVPFGPAEEEHQLNAVLTRQFTERLRGILRYGYYEGREASPRPNLNGFRAHVLYTSFFYRF